MPGERPMTRFTSHALVDALALYIEDIGMAAFTDLVTSVGNRERCDLPDGVAPIVSVLPEAAGNQQAARDQKQR